MRKVLKLAAIFVVLLGIYLFVNNCSNGRILRVKDEKIISWDEMTQEIKDKKIILIGEQHQVPKHHKYEMRIIKALYELGVPIAIGLEMFRANDEKVLEDWVAGELTPDQFSSVYYKNWAEPWSLYRDIFLFARDKKIPLIGLNVPVAIPEKVAREGFSALSQEEVRRLPPGIKCDVDDTYREFIKRAYSGHRPNREFGYFCEAQMVWDNAMALHALEYLGKNPKASAILLMGIGHAWKRAVPRQIQRLGSGYTITVILPEMVRKIERNVMTTEDTDYLILK
jgi:uncharacterized iron-regulated protein